MGILPNIMDILKRIEALQVNGPHEVPNAVIAQQLVALNNDLIKVVDYLKSDSEFRIRPQRVTTN